MEFENEIASKVLNICFGIHKTYGPGLFESVYEKILCYELAKHDLEFVCQHPIKVIHDGVNMELGCSFQTSNYLFEIDKIEVRLINKF